MFKKVAFTYYPVIDVARARKFYEGTLGLKSGSAGNQGDNWWVEYDLPGGGCLALTNFTKEKPSDTAGGTIAFEVEDLDRLMTDLKAKGVTFKSDVIHSPVCRMAVCLDSEGNSILLHQTQAEVKPHQARRSEGARVLVPPGAARYRPARLPFLVPRLEAA
jgi:predicted enzyme related to lactoylglutathione lyase